MGSQLFVNVLIFIMCVISVSHIHECSARRGQERAQDLLEQDLQVVVCLRL